MKKTIKIAIVLVLALSLSAIFFACSGKTDLKKESGNDIMTFKTAKEAYAYSAATTGGMLATLSSAGSGINNAAAEGDTSDQLSDEEIKLIEEYMVTVQALLNEGFLSTTETESDLEGYQTKMVVSCTDMLGEKFEYTMYFNETVVEEEVEEDGLEITSAIEGIMIIGEDTYTISGEKEKEEDDYEVKFTASIDENNYIRFKQEIESDEQKFVYSLYKNGTLEELSEIKVEIEEDGEQSVKMQCIRDQIRKSFKFQREFEDGIEEIKVTLGDENQTTTYKIRNGENEKGEKIYRYEKKVRDTNYGN